MSDKLVPTGAEYSDIISIIDGARYRAQKAVNAEMIQMYWDIGRYVSERVNDGGWGKNIVKEFAAFLQSHYPSAKGFSAQNIWRMKQFYETYAKNEKLSPLVRELSWTNNLAIMSGCKTDEAREFYLRLCIRHNYSKRELERQISSLLFERTIPLPDTSIAGFVLLCRCCNPRRVVNPVRAYTVSFRRDRFFSTVPRQQNVYLPARLSSFVPSMNTTS